MADDVVASINHLFNNPMSVIGRISTKPQSVTASDKYTVVVEFNSFIELTPVIISIGDMMEIWPADALEAGKWVPVMAEYEGPVYLRLSRAATIPVHNEGLQVEIGKGGTLREGSDVTIVGTGSMVGRSLLAAEKLAKEGIEARVLEIHTVKPLDVDLIWQAAEETGAIVTAEEHSVIGGLGGAVAEALCVGRPVALERVGVADTFTCTALDPESLMDACGLAVEDIVTAVKRVLGRKPR